MSCMGWGTSFTSDTILYIPMIPTGTRGKRPIGGWPSATCIGNPQFAWNVPYQKGLILGEWADCVWLEELQLLSRCLLFFNNRAGAMSVR